MKYSHIFITRPQHEAEELAARLSPLGLPCLVQPAFRYEPLDAREQQPGDFAELEHAAGEPLLIFTSPRAVEHGLPQLEPALLKRAALAAIGPATASALAASGQRVGITPRGGYTSEALLETLSGDAGESAAIRRSVFILAAPGGRMRLLEGIEQLGWDCRMIMVYRSLPAELDRAVLEALENATEVLSVWTSANAMQGLSQRLPSAAWYRICQGDWLVISERLRRLARAYGPARIHLAAGPGNEDLASAVRRLF